MVGMIGKGSLTSTLTEDDVRSLLAQTCDGLAVDGKRVLVIVPDSTRSMPMPMLFRLLYEQLGRRVERLDHLIALGTHPAMSDEAIERFCGVTRQEREREYPNVSIYNHAWNDPRALLAVGTISRHMQAKCCIARTFANLLYNERSASTGKHRLITH